MAIEIERKFLVRDIRFLQDAQGENIVQGYVAKEQGAMSTRVRIRADRAFLTIKGPRTGITRDEFEYPIPIADAVRMLSAYCNDRIVRKTRYLVHFHTQTFEVDVFEGKHAGLVVAEIELPHEGAPIVLPHWIDREVTSDPRFGNFRLAQTQQIPEDVDLHWWPGPRHSTGGAANMTGLKLSA
ncbi:adenylate cyclase [Parazoarcus communis]|uniref:Adenylate cyclase n=1 Tax=Parazoarcus communis TaxID=41977 RepID=A0A2U8GKQ7_9RHOO|nr:CYTH domain-containing protein [Parazoarcus communis]AWI74152.1 adenylate cyclase [Parazoarcus communis]